MTHYAYIRVSTADQNENRQVDAMLAEGIDPKNMYIDKMSGKNFDRKKWLTLTRKVKRGDVIFIQSLDRMGRDYTEIIDWWGKLTGKGVDIVIMDMELLDTRKGRDMGLMHVFMQDMILRLLSYVAQTERERINQRAEQGRIAARARGVHMGRKPVQVPDNFDDVVRDWQDKRLTFKEALDVLGMKPATFYNRKRERGL